MKLDVFTQSGDKIAKIKEDYTEFLNSKKEEVKKVTEKKKKATKKQEDTKEEEK